MKKEMLINVLQPEECRIAIVEDGVLEELYVERTSHESYVGNIYKGRIVNIEPSIQAAFVDFGVGRNGFLHVSDVEPAYYRDLEQRRGDSGGRRGNDRSRRRGDRGDRGERGGRPHGDRPRRPRVEDRPSLEDEIFPPEETSLLTFSDTPHVDDPTRLAEPQDRGPFEETPSIPVEKEEAPPERRRGRGQSRRRRESPASDRGAAEGSAPAGEPGEPRRDEPEPPRSEFMESAERRTEEDEEASPSVEDPDIFFSRSDDTDNAAPPPVERPRIEDSVPVTEVREEREERIESEPLESFSHEPDHFDDEDDPEAGQQFEEMSEEMIPDLDDAIDEALDEGSRSSRSREGQRDNRRGRPAGRRGFTGRPGAGRPKPLIQDIFRRGQEVLVQVIKEGIGTKGPTLSTYISIAGRYLVLMPGLNRIGVSRKIADDEQRRRLREIFSELKPPRGLGFIIRTAGIDRNKKELQGDLAYLSRLWQVVVRRIKKLKSPAEIYQESDMITRTIRDTFTSDIDTIWVDEPNAYEHAKEFCQIVMPRYANRIKLYTGNEPLFHKYGIEEEIVRIQQRHVPLPHGGSIVIDQTEALVAIDVNSGNFRADNNAEETAYQINLQAAKEIARQLRLRDLGGVIVNDFIDMRDEKHRRGVERALRDNLKRDRARTKILRMSSFGIIEMTRQRIRPSLKRSVYQDCAHCLGTGQVKTCESMSIDVMRMLQLAAHHAEVQRIQVKVAEDVANYLLNKKRKEIVRLEESGQIHVAISPQASAAPEMLEFVCYDKNNNEVKFLPSDRERSGRR